MDTHRPPGEVLYLPGGGFYVQACHQPASLRPRVRVSPGLDAAAAQRRNSASSSALLDAMDSDSDAEEEQEAVEVTTTASGSVLLDTIDPNVDETVGVSKCRRNVQPSSLLGALDATDSGDEELQLDPPFSAGRSRTRMVISGAALDLCPTVDLTSVLDTDDSASFEEEFEGSDSGESGEEPGGEVVVGKHRSTLCPLWSWECDNLPVDQVDNIIRSNMAEIEAKKPWRFVFRCLMVPFDFKRKDDPFDVFFICWDEFWRLHGRAVWERAFWQPLLPGSTEYHCRKGRQSRAQRAFRELATDLAERLGTPYRRWLGKALHEGWWYRTEPFALRRLFLRDRHLYEEYLERRVKERWPRGRKFLLQRGLKPMWWLPDSSRSV